MTDPPERRSETRIPVRIPAGIYRKDNPHDSIEGEILDISRGGAFIHCLQEIDLGKEVLVEIRFSESVLVEGLVIDYDQELWGRPPSEEPEESVVRWARTSQHPGFGIQFQDLGPDKVAFIERLIEYYKHLNNAAT